MKGCATEEGKKEGKLPGSKKEKGSKKGRNGKE